jgi:acyl-CoA synthetase (AMP-forming)/AMP-acid ligase II
MIIRGGENIYPREIEAVLLSHPAVTGAAVVGIPDRFWGEVVGAAISTSAADPPAEAELAGFCRARLAAYKVPVHWLFTDAFPLTATGKVRKDVLSAQFAEADALVTTPGRGAAAMILKRQTGRPGDPGQPAEEHTAATHQAQV